jgi:hypothetical protein
MVDDLKTPCWEEFSLDLKKMVNMVIYNKSKYFGKIVENNNGAITFNRGSFPFFEKQEQCLLASII